LLFFLLFLAWHCCSFYCYLLNDIVPCLMCSMLLFLVQCTQCYYSFCLLKYLYVMSWCCSFYYSLLLARCCYSCSSCFKLVFPL
jgi:hypothetical protein